MSNIPVCSEHYRFRIGLASFPPTRPGQFINIRCGPAEAISTGQVSDSAVEWREGLMPHLTGPETVRRVPLLRRPLAPAGRIDRPDGSVEMDIIYRVVGVGTAWMAGLKVGDEIDILGPLGNGFTIRDNKPQAAIVIGGTGIGPMLYLADALAAAGKDVEAFFGARTASLIPLTEEQRGAFTITTDDGSLGSAGMVHQPFEKWLEREKPDPAGLVVYACGPEPMMKAVAEICLADEIECQLSLERHMACGMGVCQGCNVKVKTAAPPGWKFKLVCKDGPVFDAGELIWE